MKKVLSLCLALMMTLSLCACGGGETTADIQEETVDGLWEATYTTDEFGDVVEDSETVLCSPIMGDFSNTATNGSELAGYVYIKEFTSGNHVYVLFRLLEYGDTSASYTESQAEDMVLKTKVGDQIREYSLVGSAPNGDLVLGIKNNADGDEIYNTLYYGDDVRCIIYIGNSQYNFTIESDNFAKQCDAQNINTEMDIEEALTVILRDDGRNMIEAMACLSTFGDSVEALEDDAIAEVMDGYYLYINSTTAADIENNAAFPWQYVYHYTQEGGRTAATNLFDRAFVDPETGRLIVNRDYKETPDARVLKTEIKDNLFYIESTQGNPPNAYQVKQVTDNLFLLYVQYEGGGSTLSSLLVPCEGNSILDIENALSNAIKNELPKLSF